MICEMGSQISEDSRWQSIARKKCAERDAAIPREWRLRPAHVPDSQLNVMSVPRECGVLTARETELTELDAVVLVQKIIAREFSSYEVTLAFCKRAAVAQQLVNCLSEVFFKTALKAAKALDDEYAATDTVKGPLHGLPISLKDCFQVEGVDAAVGLTAFVNQPAKSDSESELTRVMRQCGAVLFCKTSAPPALMAGETYNAIYGYTTNPYNRNCSSGGSSGGESALLALRGSPLGVGTDVGGSIRIPASFCGLYSLKPSFGRFSTHGLRDCFEGQEAVRNCVGPMATSLDTISLWSEAVVGAESYKRDPDCLPILWRNVKVPEKLCFGLLMDDGVVKPLPPVTRALLQTKAALEAAGHKVIQFHGSRIPKTDGLKYSLYRSAAADAMSGVLAQTGEPWSRGYEMLEQMVSREALTTTDVQAATVTELWKAQAERSHLAAALLRAWSGTISETGTGREMDALLMPCTAWPACRRHDFSYDNYTSAWNVFDFCATTIPVTQVSTKDGDSRYKCRNQTEEQVWKDYSVESLAGCPVSVQLVGRRLHEEYLLEVSRCCDSAIKRYME